MSALIRIEKTAAETALAAEFASLAASEAAERAYERFERLGVPSRRVESWHYTDLRAAMKEAAPLAPAPSADALAEAKSKLAAEARLAPSRLVLLDGRFCAELSDSLPTGVALASSAPETPIAVDADAMLALAAAFARGGLALTIAPDIDAGRIEVIHLSGVAGRVASFARIALRLGDGARATVVERSLGAGRGAQRHRLTSVALGKNARLEHVVSIEDSAEFTIESVVVDLAEAARYLNFGLVIGGDLTRRQIFADLREPGGAILLAGLALIDGVRRADTTLEVTHSAPRGESREFYRHIVADEAAGVFQGKVIVAPRAQKTDGAMKSQAILISPTATMMNKPELEIYADDVVCGHGATVGALDPEQVFYLETRGLPRAEAEAMLMEAFGVEAIERIDDVVIADAMRARLSAWLGRRGARP